MPRRHGLSRASRAILLLACAALSACGVDGTGDAGGRSGAARNGGDATGGSRAGGRAGRGGPSITLAPSDIGTVTKAPLEEGTPITGDLLPLETVQVRARLEGDLVDVYVREGDRVRAGQLLALFDSVDERSARESAEARVAAAKGDLATAEWTATQTEELFKAGAVAEREFRAAQQAVASAKAQLAAAEALFKSSETVLADTRVLSPTDGTVAQRTAESGEHVSRGSALFTVVRSDSLELAASVPARRASSVIAGQLVRFTADGRSFEGRVARVSPTIDPATRSVTVFVHVPNGSGALKGGTFAMGRVIGRRIADALVIPTAGVRQSAGTDATFVWRIDGTQLAQTPVRLGVVDEGAGLAQVVDGLALGDRIVIGNVGTVGTGMQVQVIGADAGGRR